MKHRNNKTAKNGYWYETPDGMQKTRNRPTSPANPTTTVNKTPPASPSIFPSVPVITPPNSPKASVNNVFSPVFNQIGKVKNSLSALEKNLKGGKSRKNRNRKSRKNRKSHKN